ncbi:MAG TPA: M14 family zinc carboxypeptidase, partial [Thermoleophilaceae bacterium]|nr:M14 family zinc carboxypeptidase [Thermoleophilaceae bacterium]
SSDQAPDYRGAGPFSEPESEAVRRLVATRNVTMLITNHTSGRLVLRPPGVRAQGTVPDEAALRALGDRMAAAMGYTSERSWELYDNSGTTEDWSYGVTGAYGYTIESSDQNFHEAYEKAVVGEYLRIGGGGNREAFLRALEAAADPASHAVIEGFAPPGRTLRLTRTVGSRTGPVCLSQPTGFFSTDCGATSAPLSFSDQLAVTRRVGGDGVVGWHVNPSVSPLARQSGPWELTCADASGRVLERRAVPVRRGGSVRVFLRCGPPSCVTARAVRSLAVRTGAAARVRLRLRKGARAPRIRVLRAARGRLRVAARPTLRRGRAAWRPRRDGTYVLEAKARSGRRTQVLRRSLVVRRGRVARGPAFARTDGCRELRVARVSTPQLARSGPRARLLLRSLADVTARVRVSRGRRTLERRTLTLRGGRLTRLALPRAKGGRVTVTVATARGTAALPRRSAVRLRVRGR